MDAEYVRERITALRLKKGVSEYKMSYDLGHSRGYINNISSGKTLPSMTEFLVICDYFEITPEAFFNPELPDPQRRAQVLDRVDRLDSEDLKKVLQFIDWIK